MLEKKTLLDQVEITRDGHIQCRLALIVLEDGVEISSRYHRFVVPPGYSPEEIVKAVNADITIRKELKAAPVEDKHISFVKDVCSLVHTPEVVSKHKESMDKGTKELHSKFNIKG